MNLPDLLFYGFLVLASSIFFLYRVVEKRFNYAMAEYVRIVQVFLLTVFYLLHGYLTLGYLNMILFLAISFTVSAIAEISGTSRGWIFGKYHYNDHSCPLPSLFGVPLCYPLIWSGLVYIGMWLAILILHSPASAVIEFDWKLILLTAALVTLLDVILDPIAVDEKRWTWANRGRFYGVPLSNFMGWAFTSALIMLTVVFTRQSAPTLTGLNEWFIFTPAWGYGILALACVRVCRERQLKIPAYTAAGTALLVLVVSLFKLYF